MHGVILSLLFFFVGKKLNIVSFSCWKAFKKFFLKKQLLHPSPIPSHIPIPVAYTFKPEARSVVTSDSRMLQDVFLSILVTITMVVGVGAPLITPVTPLLAPYTGTLLATLKQQLRNLRQVSHCKTFSRGIV